MDNLAKTQRKSLEIKGGLLPTGNMWEIANRHGNEVVKALKKLAVPMIKAGAAFWLLRAGTGDGEWLATLEAHSTHDRTAVWRWMQTAEHALQHIGYAVEERAMRAIIAARQDEFGAALLTALNDAIKGKTGRQLQLEFGIRKPVKPLLPPGAAVQEDGLTDEQRAAARVQVELREAMRGFEDGLARLSHHSAVLSDPVRAAVGWACARQVVSMLPDGWTVQVMPPTGKPLTIEQVFAEHLGLEKP